MAKNAAHRSSQEVVHGVVDSARNQQDRFREDVRKLLDDFRTNVLAVYQSQLIDEFETKVKSVVIKTLAERKVVSGLDNLPVRY